VPAGGCRFVVARRAVPRAPERGFPIPAGAGSSWLVAPFPAPLRALPVGRVDPGPGLHLLFILVAQELTVPGARLGREARDIPVFPILFGDSDRSELARIADLTGDRLFDARQGSLDGAFEEIRGYQ
jgi:hypothetical protein